MIEEPANNPTSAIAFQWHTSAAYMTDVPITYLIGALAVQKKAFSRLSTQDQAIVREEMGKIFKRMDKLNRDDNQAAKAALARQGITFVEPSAEEIERWRKISNQSVDEMIEDGIVPRDIIEQVRSHLQSYRSSQ